MPRSVVDPLRAFPSYASLLSFLLTIDLQTPLVGKLLQLLIQHPNLTLSEISKAFRAEEEKGSKGRGGDINALVFTAMASHPSLTVKSPLCLDIANPESLKSSAKPSIRLDAALREIVSRLVLHRVITCTDSDGGNPSSSRNACGTATSAPCYYSLQSGTALLLRLYYPLVLQWIRNKFGDVGERLACFVHQLGVVPLRAAIETLANAAAVSKEVPPLTSLFASVSSSRGGNICKREGSSSSSSPHNGSHSGGEGREEQDVARSLPAARAKTWINLLHEVGISMVRYGVFEVVNRDTDESDGGAVSEEEKRTGGINMEGEMRSKTMRLESGNTIASSSLPSSHGIPHWCIRWNVSHLARLLVHAAMRQLVQERVTNFSGGTEVVAVPAIVLDVFFTAQEKAWLHVSGTSSRLGSSFSTERQWKTDRASSSNVPIEQFGGSRAPGGGTSAEEEQRGNAHALETLGFPPPLPVMSTSPVPFAAFIHAVQQQQHHLLATSQRRTVIMEDQVRRVLECLREDVIGRNGLVGRSKFFGAEATCAFVICDIGSNQDLYRLHYAALCTALRLTVVEKVIFARHGVLGVRTFKLLMAHHFLEDKSLAELLVAAQPQTRELLHDMMKDGLLQQKEISKVDVSITSERQPKHQIYLWGLQAETQLIPRIREIIAQSLLKAVFRLNALHRRASASPSPMEESILQDPDFSAPSVHSGNTPSASSKERWDNSSDGVVKQEEPEESSATFLPHVGSPPLGLPDSNVARGNGRISFLPHNTADFDALVHHQRQLIGIESVILAHMRMLFIMDFV